MSIIDLPSAEDEIKKFWKAHFAAEWDWLMQVVLGEFDDHQSTSAIIASLLTSFVPGAVIVMSARDMTAVIIRMVRHPEKREEITEWMILVACALGLVPALVGAAAAAIVGGIVGDEAGAALRATAVLLIEDGSRMLEKLVGFLRRFGQGDLIQFLRGVHFEKFAEPAIEQLSKFAKNMIGIVEGVTARARAWTWLRPIEDMLAKLEKLEHGFREVEGKIASKVPGAIREFDVRLQRALSEEMAQADHVVHPETPAPHPTPKPPTPKRVAARADHPLGKPPGLEPADPLPPKTPPDKNLHPQGVEDEPSAAKAENKATPAEIAARQKTARDYYERTGWPPEKIDSHMKGIDFNQPVDVVELPKDTEVIQYQVPGRQTGNYFAPPGTSAESIGVDPTGRVANTYTTTEDTEVLRSTAIDTSNDLSLPENARGAGGGTQYFTADQSKFQGGK